MSEEHNPYGAQPNKLSPMRSEEVLAKAQAIFDVRGLPPYQIDGDVTGTDEELDKYNEAVNWLLSDFVHYWVPFINRSKRG